MVDFVDAVAGDAQDTWARLLGPRYERTVVSLFRDAVQSACGAAESATGPFYCPGDRNVYLDLGFFAELSQRFGAPVYARIDAPASARQRQILKALSAADVRATSLAGEPILDRLTHAPGNGAPIGGLKVVAENGWFAARPSGTEDIYKIYAESFKGPEHLQHIQDEARAIVSATFAAAGA